MGGTIEVCHSCGNARHGVAEAGCLEELRRKAGLWDRYLEGVERENARQDVEALRKGAKDTIRRYGTTAEEVYEELRRIVKDQQDAVWLRVRKDVEELS